MPIFSSRECFYERVHWGITGCAAPHCMTAADLTIDDEPFCLECADLLMERWVAISIDPKAETWLPTLYELFGSDDPFRGN